MKNIIKKFHKDQDGAVLILCLAAILILLLVSFVIFDAGKSARTKLRLQSAADTAAYSQAATKARSMNMLAYTNIAKRSIWGIHSLYPSYLTAHYNWIRTTINANCDECEDPESEECDTCMLAISERTKWINRVCEAPPIGDTNDNEENTVHCESGNPVTWGTFRTMTNRDYGTSLKLDADHKKVISTVEFAPLPGEPERTPEFGAESAAEADPSGSLFENYHAQDMRALDNYQRYLVGLTPWWAWMEQLMRSTRNGATMSVSWPVPEGQMPASVAGLIGVIDSLFSIVASDGGSVAPTGYKDSLPVYPTKMGTMRETIKSIVGGAPSTIGTCIKNALFGGGNGCTESSFHPFLIEHLVNVVMFALKSDGFVGGDFDDLSQTPQLISLHYNGAVNNFKKEGLNFTEQSFENVMGDERIAAEPYALDRFGGSAGWQAKSSNIVFAYDQDFGRSSNSGMRQKYSILKDYRDSSMEAMWLKLQFHGFAEIGVRALAQEVTYGTSGYWSMSRGEIFFNDSDGNPPDLWSPSWSARLRPVSIGDEFEQGGYDLRDAYREVMPLMSVAIVLGMSSLSDLPAAIFDLAYMDRVSQGMGSSTIQGVTK